MDQASSNVSPFAGKLMSGADMILSVLSEEGVDTLFGYSGGAILPTYDAVFRFNEERALTNPPKLRDWRAFN